MLTTRSPPLTPEPPLSLEKTHRLVRETFDQTWRDYYEWKPPVTLSIINGELERGALAMEQEIVANHQSMGEELRRMVEQEEGDRSGAATGQEGTQGHHQDLSQSAQLHPDCFRSDRVEQEEGEREDETNQFLGYQGAIISNTPKSSKYSLYIKPAPTQKKSDVGPKAGRSSSNSSKTPQIRGRHFAPVTAAKRLNMFQTTSPASMTPKEGRYILGPTQDVKTLPPYCFCIAGEANVYKEDERSMPFIPIFENPEDFDEDKYHESFGCRTSWTGTWRDPNVDIIQVEALARIRDKFSDRITSEEIDNTRILPLEVARIENLDLSRDLPPFPLEPSHTESEQATPLRPSKRKWNQPLAVDQDSADEEVNMDDYGEFWCGRPGCTMYGCPRHSALENNHLSLHSSSARQKPIHLSYIPRTRARLPSNPDPCSAECYSLVRRDSLRDQAAQAAIWPDGEIQSLVEIMGSDQPMEGDDLCTLRLITNGRTCREVVVQILALTLKDPTTPAPTLTTDLTSTTIAVPAATVLTVPRLKLRVTTGIHTVGPTVAPNYQECNHPGPCSTADCWCFKENWMCGRNCGCSWDCERRFKGCQCYKLTSAAEVANGHRPGKAVCLPDKCPCAKMSRECDPELCGPCGAAEELQDAREHKYDALLAGSGKGTLSICGNVDLQKAIWPKIIVGISPVSGYGIFAQEYIEKERMIGGEWIRGLCLPTNEED
uniref:CXC domain-containing protein n=1 Tax=Kwoniella dejecticola CBS 10117 TaxID=1296121 RepID=A0A1A6AFY4_9TREE|nr:uncharacterized protein I303_00756 [Kwoniella dejecticola CBS 10117]OBR88938.1 hypothetical protein I303_00756 [Kwoniella dejecticola CBS 10117]